MNNIEQYKELTGGCLLNNKTGKEWDFSAIMGTLQQGTNVEYPVNFRLWSPCIYNQLSKSTCVSYSLSTMKQIQDYYDTNTNTRYSTSFIYLLREMNQYKGDGMMIAEALENLRNKGVVPYSLMPDNFNYTEGTTVGVKVGQNQELLDEAKKHKIANYAIANTADEIKQSLYINHSPVPIGVIIRESFYNITNNGVAPIPKATEKNYGGHCMLITGWTNISGKEYWVVQNSWGEDWGDNGYCYLEINSFPIAEKYIVFDIQDYPVNITDISGRWSEEAIIKCIRSGVLSGYQDGTFKPTNPITREELASVIVRVLNKIN